LEWWCRKNKGEERKYFFFEKKKQKTFIYKARSTLNYQKVLGSFFQKRTASSLPIIDNQIILHRERKIVRGPHDIVGQRRHFLIAVHVHRIQVEHAVDR
jgi:hypothetical protein